MESSGIATKHRLVLCVTVNEGETAYLTPWVACPQQESQVNKLGMLAVLEKDPCVSFRALDTHRRRVHL